MSNYFVNKCYCFFNYKKCHLLNDFFCEKRVCSILFSHEVKERPWPKPIHVQHWNVLIKYFSTYRFCIRNAFTSSRHTGPFRTNIILAFWQNGRLWLLKIKHIRNQCIISLNPIFIRSNVTSAFKISWFQLLPP